MTHLCVAIFVNEIALAKRDIALAAEAGADLVELRIDRIADPLAPDFITALLSDNVLPCIVTCRPVWEGGQSELGNADRISVLEAALRGDVAYLDIELAALPSASGITGLPRDSRPGLIVSCHDFKGRPERLYNLLAEMSAGPGDINKIVWTARTVRDNLEAFEILQTRQKPTIALCMGEEGLISRVLAKKFGAFLTFASLESAGGTAPGQISIHDMKRLYRWDAIGSMTGVYGVVAQPVAHSMSPAIHNAAFEEIGFDGVYLPLLVNAGYESFKAFMESFLAFEPLHLRGLSITIPHKENALRYLQEKNATIDPLAVRIGAVNTIVIDRSSSALRLSGTSTDYSAILDCITEKLDITRSDLAKYRVAVIGAGGTGRTAVAALAHYGAAVTVYNRTQARADTLAAEFNGQRGRVTSASLEQLGESDCQIYINTSSIGMHPRSDQSPFDVSPPRLLADSLVFDAVYNPPETKLLQHARSAGARTISGVEMFVRQAAAQFQAWTGQPAPLSTMRQVVENRLNI